MKTEGNDPAQPATVAYNEQGQYIPQIASEQWLTSGLTKREYFAAMAMQGYISAGSTGMPTPEQLADYAVRTSDALIEALNKEVSNG